MKRHSILVLALFLLAGCPESGRTWPPPPVAGEKLTLTNLGQTVRVDEHHRASIPDDFRLVDRHSESYWLLVRRSGWLGAVNVADGRKVTLPSDRRSHGGGWSADGTRWFDFEHQVREVDVRTLGVRKLTRICPGGEYREWVPGRTYLHVPGEEKLITALRYNGSPPLFSREGKKYPPGKSLVLEIDLRGGAERIVHHDAKEVPRFGASRGPRLLFLAYRHRIDVRDLNGRKIESLPMPDRGCGWITPSRDGRRLLVEGSWLRNPPDPGFAILDVRTGETLAELDVGHAFRWSPDEKRLAYLRRSDELWVHDLQTGESTPVAAVDTYAEESQMYYAGPAWSRDGRMLAAALCGSRGWQHHSHYAVIVDLEKREVSVRNVWWNFLSWVPERVGVFR